MMKAIKGCINNECVAYQEQVVFKKEEKYCTKCGEPLSYVCKRCHVPLDNDSEKYCVRCTAARQDHVAKNKKKVAGAVGAAGAAAIGVGGIVVKGGKVIAKVIPKP